MTIHVETSVLGVEYALGGKKAARGAQRPFLPRGGLCLRGWRKRLSNPSPPSQPEKAHNGEAAYGQKKVAAYPDRGKHSRLTFSSGVLPGNSTENAGRGHFAATRHVSPGGSGRASLRPHCTRHTLAARGPAQNTLGPAPVPPGGIALLKLPLRRGRWPSN